MEEASRRTESEKATKHEKEKELGTKFDSEIESCVCVSKHKVATLKRKTTS